MSFYMNFFINILCWSYFVYMLYIMFLVIIGETDYKKNQRRLRSNAESMLEFGTIENKSVEEIVEILDYREKLEQQDWTKLI